MVCSKYQKWKVGDEVKTVSKYRKFLGLTQKDVSELLGISTQAYSRKEREYVAFTDKEKIIIRDEFRKEFPNITVGEIFFDEKVSKVE